MSETPSYPALIELISRLEGKDRKTCEMALYCLNKADRRDKRLRDRTEDIAEENVKLRAENEKLRAALDDLLHVSQNMECELQVGEIELYAPFKKAWREAIRAAAAALKETGDE